MVRCLKVPLDRGEEIRSELRQKGMLDLSHTIVRDGDHLLIPIVGEAAYQGLEVKDRDLPPIPRKETDYRKLTKIPDELIGSLPSSFDVIGDVAIMKLDEPLLPHAEDIADALMEANGRLRSVALDQGVKGEFRVRDLKLLRGETDLSSIHTEYGVVMEVDPSLAYFNPRLSRERMRVAELVREGEVVVDMFAGVGPFPLMICRHSKPAHVFAIDMNPDAVEIMKSNILRNRLDDRITAINDDARDAMRSLPELDRVIMNLPHISEEFIFHALHKLKAGGMIHLYKILERDDLVSFQNRIISIAESSGRNVDIDGIQELKTYSPTMSVYCFDIRC